MILEPQSRRAVYLNVSGFTRIGVFFRVLWTPENVHSNAVSKLHPVSLLFQTSRSIQEIMHGSVLSTLDGFKQYTTRRISLVVHNHIGVAFRDIGLPNLTPYLPEAVIFIPLAQDACIAIPLTIHLHWVIEAGGAILSAIEPPSGS